MRTSTPAGLTRWAVAATVALAGVLGVAGTAAAVPPPPANPSDSQISSSQAEANAKAGEVGQLTNRLAEAETRLSDLQDQVDNPSRIVLLAPGEPYRLVRHNH